MTDDRPVVPADHRPLVDALARLGADLGSVSADQLGQDMNTPEILPPLPAGRFLVAATADVPAMLALFKKLPAELVGTGYACDGRVVLVGPADAPRAVFLDVPVVVLQ